MRDWVPSHPLAQVDGQLPSENPQFYQEPRNWMIHGGKRRPGNGLRFGGRQRPQTSPSLTGPLLKQNTILLKYPEIVFLAFLDFRPGPFAGQAPWISRAAVPACRAKRTAWFTRS